MSIEDTLSGQCGHGRDAGAYVLGALEADELDAFRLHLSRCETCRAEVNALQQVADALPDAAPVLAPPPDLRRRVMDVVRADHEAGPAVAARRPSETSRRRSPFSLRRLPAFGGALVVAAAIVVAIVLATGGSSTRVIQASVNGAGTARLIVTGAHGKLVVNHFPGPGAGRIYQVWLQRAGQAPSPGPTRTLFDVTSSGAGRVSVAGNLHGVKAVLVTSEPSGGSPTPTRTPVITADL
jgi:anti-sigma-K factor RskA